jgi:hypothetical protein
VQHHEDALKAGAQSAKNVIEDLELKMTPSTSQAPKKATTWKDVVEVTSSGGPPPNSDNHVHFLMIPQ